MSVTIWKISDEARLPPAGDWLLALREGEWLADDAVEMLAQTATDAVDRIDAVAVPTYNYIGIHLLHGPAFYPALEIRLIRRTALGRVREHLFKSPSADLPFAWQALDSPGTVHVHRRLGDDLKDFARRRCEIATSRIPGAASLHDQIARAYEAVNSNDDDWSTAAAMIESWARLVEGVMAWEEKSGGASLKGVFSLPIMTVKRDGADASHLAAAQDRLGRLGEELDRLRAENARLHAISPLTWIRRACRGLKGKQPPIQ